MTKIEIYFKVQGSKTQLSPQLDDARVEFEIGMQVGGLAAVWFSARTEKRKYLAFFVGLKDGDKPIHGIVALRKSRRLFRGDSWRGAIVYQYTKTEEPNAAIEEILKAQGRWIEFNSREEELSHVKYSYNRLKRFLHPPRPQMVVTRKNGDEIPIAYREVNSE